MHNPTKTAIGTKHGRLTIIEELGSRMTKSGRGRGFVRCKCDCGNEIVINRHRISVADGLGKTISCGCISKERHLISMQLQEKKKKERSEHSAKIAEQRRIELEKTKEQRETRRCILKRLNGMIRRCADVSIPAYGGKGIRVCDEWKTNKEAFVLWSISHGFRKELEIDRINEDKDYCPDNCQWISRQDNLKKKDNTKSIRSVVITVDGVSLTLRDWERRLGYKRGTITWRVNHGWSDKESLYGKGGVVIPKMVGLPTPFGRGTANLSRHAI